MCLDARWLSVLDVHEIGLLDSHLMRCSEFEEFRPGVVDSYETMSSVGKVVGSKSCLMRTVLV